MNSIDIKSLLIGALLTSTVIFGVAATGKTDAWDTEQQWEWKRLFCGSRALYNTTMDYAAGNKVSGWEPIEPEEGGWVWARRRVK